MNMGLDGAVRRYGISSVVFLLMSTSVLADPLETGSVLSCEDDLFVVVGRIHQSAVSEPSVHVQMFRDGDILAAHLPFTVQALGDCFQASSSDAATFESDAFEDGWATWREAQGGFFTVSAPEVASMLLGLTKPGS